MGQVGISHTKAGETEFPEPPHPTQVDKAVSLDSAVIQIEPSEVREIPQMDQSFIINACATVKIRIFQPAESPNLGHHFIRGLVLFTPGEADAFDGSHPVGTEIIRHRLEPTDREPEPASARRRSIPE